MNTFNEKLVRYKIKSAEKTTPKSKGTIEVPRMYHGGIMIVIKL